MSEGPAKKKRTAEVQLNRDDFEAGKQDAGPGALGSWQESAVAPPEELAKRRIVKVKRKGTAAPSASKAAPAAATAAPTFNFGIPAPAAQKNSDEKKPEETKAEDTKPVEPAGEEAKEGEKDDQTPASGEETKAAEGSKPPPKFEFKAVDFKQFGSESKDPPKFNFTTPGKTFDFGNGSGFKFNPEPNTGFKFKPAESTTPQTFEGSEGNTAAKAVVEVEKVDTKTGEEGDEVLFTIPRAKLFVMEAVKQVSEKEANPTGAQFEGDLKKADEEKKAGEGKQSHEWQECGVGEVRISKYGEGKYRVLMRTDKTLRTMLNSPLNSEWPPKKPDTKLVTFFACRTADGKAEIKQFMLKVKKPEEADEFVANLQKYQALTAGGGSGTSDAKPEETAAPAAETENKEAPAQEETETA